MSGDVILLAHGSGGRLSHDLVEKLFLRHFDNPALLQLDDSAVLEISSLTPSVSNFRLAFTTDSYVVSPLFFPGGDIGKLAVCGTVNDLSMSGARPLWLSAGFIVEEGLPLADLERIVASMATTARQAGVQIVAGDTKVVDRGSADRLFINTTGVGLVPPGVSIAGDQAQPGDLILLNGTIGDHGMTIMTQREGLQFDSPLESDCAPLHDLVGSLLAALPPGTIHCLRDPTRGGLATTLNELALRSRAGIEIDETAVPVRQAVRGAWCSQRSPGRPP
jgi:hydrogenase expression/formation protein HypE